MQHGTIKESRGLLLDEKSEHREKQTREAKNSPLMHYNSGANFELERVDTERKERVRHSIGASMGDLMVATTHFFSLVENNFTLLTKLVRKCSTAR